MPLSSRKKTNNDCLGEQSGRPMLTVGTHTDGTREGNGKHTVGTGTQTDGIGTALGRLTMACDSQTSKNAFRVAEQRDQLLPGIPDEITLSEIAPKLPWSAFRTLSSVCLGWQQAIRGRQACSTESLVVLNHTCSGGEAEPNFEAISLYSMRDNCCYQLPRIPFFPLVTPAACVSLDGKIYVMGGFPRGGLVQDDNELANLPHFDQREQNGDEVFVLDVAGKRKWKQCASMEHDRRSFACGALNGKIYVFGGITGSQPYETAYESEVYDPVADTWSSIEPMSSLRYAHSVTAIGEELFVYGGECFDDDEPDPVFMDVAHSLEIYHPVRNEWRVIEPFGMNITERTLMAQGNFYSMALFGIFVHDNDVNENKWTPVHSFSLPEFVHPPSGSGNLEAVDYPVLAVENELLTISQWHNSVTDTYDLCLIRSKGFGSKKKELVWEKANCSLNLIRGFLPPFLCPLQL